MNRRARISLLVALTALAAACSSTEAGLEPEPAITPLEPPPGAAEPEPSSPAKPRVCHAPLVDPACTTLAPAPATADSVETFVRDNAIPLRCTVGGGAALWDLRALERLYGDQRMFMLGEVHGQNEIGILSSLLLEQLASKKLVNVVGFELPMDLQASLQRYVETEQDATAKQLLRQFAPNFFGRILTVTARELAKRGVTLRVAAVDVPMDPGAARRAIEEVAAKLTTQRETVLATLPEPPARPPSDADLANADAYFELVTGKKAEICAELAETDCDRLVAMTHALWVVTTTYAKAADPQLWFRRREEVIYYNLRSKMAEPDDRMFLHMGTAHTSKRAVSAGGRMAREHALTKGRVFSVAPAYGTGSVVFYGEDRELPGEPLPIVSALTDAPEHPFFVSTTRPSATCVANPLAGETDETVSGGTRAELYDGYIHYGALTSERRPEATRFSRESAVAVDASHDASGAFRAYRARLEQLERAALAAGVLGRRRLP